MRAAPWLAAACLWATAQPTMAQEAACTLSAIGSAVIEADGGASVTEVSTQALPGNGGRYCLVRVRAGGNVNIAVGLPMDGRWNGRLQAEGNGGFAGQALAPVKAVARGYVGAQTDTGHPAEARDPEETPAEDWRNTTGAFALQAKGVPNRQLREDFAHRAVHLMAVVAKQVATAFYGRAPSQSYLAGCSTGGGQGLRAAQDHPADFDGILAGDPFVNFAQVLAYQSWPQVVMKERTGGAIIRAKLDLATQRAVAACDGLDGLVDGLLTDPRQCRYSAARDSGIVRAKCGAEDGACLSRVEAAAIDEIWRGPRTAGGKALWRGIERGAPLHLLAGEKPFPYALVQPRYWVYLDPAWDWRSLTLRSYPRFFRESVAAVSPIMDPSAPDLAPFFARGGKIMVYHGWNDGGILPHGSILWYESMLGRMKLPAERFQSSTRLFLLPGVGHCGGGDAPQPPVEAMFDALAGWVERGEPPQGLTAVQKYSDGRERSRPLCAWPALPYYRGSGDPDLASSFACRSGRPIEREQ